GDRFAFESDVPIVSATNDEFPVHIRFTYTPPPSLPSNWPARDWCSSLATRVATAVARFAALNHAEEFLDRRRATTDRIAAALEQDLRSAGVLPNTVSV